MKNETVLLMHGKRCIVLCLLERPVNGHQLGPYSKLSRDSDSCKAVQLSYTSGCVQWCLQRFHFNSFHIACTVSNGSIFTSSAEYHKKSQDLRHNVELRSSSQ